MREAPQADADIGTLVQRASENGGGPERMVAVSDLKALRLRQAMAHELCALVENAPHPAWRATAAQVLGYHQAPARFSELRRSLLARVREELDPGVAASIAFALRGTADACGLLGDSATGAEAAAGVPLDEGTWEGVLGHLVSGLDAAAEALLLRRLRSAEDASWVTVDFLLTAELPPAEEDPTPRVRRIFASLPQSELLAALLDANADIHRTHQEIWPGILRRERKRALTEIFVDCVAEAGPEGAMLDILLARTSADDSSFDRCSWVARMLFASLDTAGAELAVSCAEGLGREDDSETLRRLAEVLVMLGRQNPEILPSMQRALASWERVVPGIQLKALRVMRARAR